MVFGYYVVSIPILFIRIFLLSSTTGFENLNNLKGEPYYILQPLSALNFYLIRGGYTFLYSIHHKNIFSSYTKETPPSFQSIQFSNNIYNYQLLQLIYNCLQLFKLETGFDYYLINNLQNAYNHETHFARNKFC